MSPIERLGVAILEKKTIPMEPEETRKVRAIIANQHLDLHLLRLSEGRRLVNARPCAFQCSRILPTIVDAAC